MKKLINDTIRVDKKDFKIVLELLNAFASERNDPYLTDAAQTMRDILFPTEGDTTILSDIEKDTHGQIKFK